MGVSKVVYGGRALIDLREIQSQRTSCLAELQHMEKTGKKLPALVLMILIQMTQQRQWQRS